jgi:hypothetical protein
MEHFMSEKISNQQLEQITKEAESGNGQALADALVDLGYEERITLLRRMDTLNQEHRRKDGNLPDLEINVGVESRVLDWVPYLNHLGHHNMYAGVRCSSPLFSNISSGGIYYESFDPINLDRTTYFKPSSHWTWSERSIKPE